MIGLALVLSTLLVGQAAAPAHPADKQKTTSKARAVVNPEAALAEYNVLKEKTPMTTAAQWRLALWCEEHGLKDIAYVHFGEVIRLDPKRDAAWRRLGFKKHGNHWASDAQIAEDQEQKKADKFWAPHLKKVHKDIHGTNGVKKKEIAQAELDKISDARAVVSVYREFGGGGKSDQLMLVEILGRIDKPILVEGAGPRRCLRQDSGRSSESDRDPAARPSEDFLDLLVGLMIDPFKYEVRPVGGPGSPGVLFVEGEKFNVNRFYCAARGTEHHAATWRHRHLRSIRHADNQPSRPGVRDHGRQERNRRFRRLWSSKRKWMSSSTLRSPLPSSRWKPRGAPSWPRTSSRQTSI